MAKRRHVEDEAENLSKLDLHRVFRRLQNDHYQLYSPSVPLAQDTPPCSTGHCSSVKVCKTQPGRGTHERKPRQFTGIADGALPVEETIRQNGFPAPWGHRQSHSTQRSSCVLHVVSATKTPEQRCFATGMVDAGRSDLLLPVGLVAKTTFSFIRADKL